MGGRPGFPALDPRIGENSQADPETWPVTRGEMAVGGGEEAGDGRALNILGNPLADLLHGDRRSPLVFPAGLP